MASRVTRMTLHPKILGLVVQDGGDWLVVLSPVLDFDPELRCRVLNDLLARLGGSGSSRAAPDRLVV